MEEWKTYRLGELLQIRYGKDHKALADGPFPAYGSGGLMRSVEKPIYNKQSILIPRKGSLNNIIYVDIPFWTVDTMFWTIIDTSIVMPHYLYYALKDFDFASLNVGSAVPSLTCPVLEAIEVPIPSLQLQRQILNCIEPIDDKIALNNCINHNLEEQAQALYKSWFIDFEPFKDGKFVDSELGLIPEKWSVKSLGEVTKEMRDKVGARQDVKVLSPVTSGRLVLSEEFFTKQVFSENIAKYLLVRPGDFAYNPARVNIGSLGLNEYSFDGCVSPVYVVFRCENGYNHFFDLYRTTVPFKDEVLSRSSGGVRQTLGYKDFALIRIVYPPKDVIDSFNSLYERLIAVQKSKIQENEILSSQRDALLPLLISGQVLCVDLNC